MQKLITLGLALLCSGPLLAQQATLLVYKVWEPGIEPYFSRFLINDDYLRIDEGSDRGGFTLLDRVQEIIYNVSHDDQSVLVMRPAGPVPDMNDTLLLTEQTNVDAAAPLIAGKKPSNVKLLANGETCVELVAVEGLLPEAVDALRDLKLTLARIHAATRESMPLELQTPCDLSQNLYAADRSLDFGLPIQERSEVHSQSLVDFDPAFETGEDTFEVPADYQRSAMPTLQGI